MQQDDELKEVFLASGTKQAPEGAIDFFFIRPSKTSIYVLNPDTIIAAAASVKSILLYVRIHPTSPYYRTFQLKNITMKELVVRLKNYPYVQCHKQSLFNIQYFAGIEGDEILLTCKIDKHIYIGRTFKEMVMNAVQTYFFQKNCFWLFGNF